MIYYTKLTKVNYYKAISILKVLIINYYQIFNQYRIRKVMQLGELKFWLIKFINIKKN